MKPNHELGVSRNQKGEKMQIVNYIDDQTKLLVLNEAIKSVQEDKQGKGLTVVADKMRKIAERKINIMQEIADLMEQKQAEICDANDLINKGRQEILYL